MKLTYEMAEKIFDMKNAGKSIKEISEELGVSDQTVRNRLKSAEETQAEPEPVQEEKKAEEPEKAEKLPVLKMTIKAVEFKGSYGKYEVNDGDITMSVDYLPVKDFPKLILEMMAMQKKLEQGI